MEMKNKPNDSYRPSSMCRINRVIDALDTFGSLKKIAKMEMNERGSEIAFRFYSVPQKEANEKSCLGKIGTLIVSGHNGEFANYIFSIDGQNATLERTKITLREMPGITEELSFTTLGTLKSKGVKNLKYENDCIPIDQFADTMNRVMTGEQVYKFIDEQISRSIRSGNDFFGYRSGQIFIAAHANERI